MSFYRLAPAIPLALFVLCPGPVRAQDAPLPAGRPGVTRPAERDPHDAKGHDHGGTRPGAAPQSSAPT